MARSSRRSHGRTLRASDHARVWKRRALYSPRFVKVESRRAYRMACVLFWSILSYSFCQRYVISIGIVRETSMAPTLSDGDYFLVNKYLYHMIPPRRGDIVVLRRGAAEPSQYVKRVIGLGGETLLIRGGVVSIDGRRLDEPYAHGGTFPDLGPYWLQPERYFVMGDNRTDSHDSRHFGSVARRDIDGGIAPGKLFKFW